MDAAEIYPQKNQRETRIDTTRGRRVHIPNSRWYSKIVRERQRFPRNHSKAGTFPIDATVVEHFSHSRMEQQNCLEETTESENQLCGGNNLQGVKISEKNF